MQHTSTFQHFMQGLLKDLNAPTADDPKNKADIGNATDHVFKLEIIEGPACDVVFCVRLGIDADALSAIDLRSLLAHNQPQTGATPNIVGLHPQKQDLCLWCREPIENLRLSPCIDMLKRLIHQAEEIRKTFEASTARLTID